MSADRGALVEHDFIRLCLERGWPVYRPVRTDGPVDVVFDRGAGLERGQVKSGDSREGTPSVVKVDLRRNTKDRASYDPDTLDVLVVGYERTFWIIPWKETGDRHISIPIASSDSKYAAWRVT